MKKIVIVMLMSLLVVLNACQIDEDTLVDDPDKVNELSQDLLSDTYIEWYGRTEYKNNDMYFYYTATGFKVKFYGRIVEFSLGVEDKNNDIYFAVAKDGELLTDSDVIVLEDDQQTFQVTYDSYDTHTLEVVKRSEPEDGITFVSSIKTNGEFLEIEETEQLHFLMVGASGISGHGALGTEGESRTTGNSSSLHAFGYLVAQHYNGSFEFVSNSGWGLKYGYNDRSGEVNIYEAYDYIGIDPNQDIVMTSYDHEKTPDVIIVNIGGNDYTSVINSYTGFEKQEKIDIFKTQVANFILKLRSDAPGAQIIWTMTSGSQNGTAAGEVINLLDDNDKSYVHLVIIKQVGEDGDPIGAHNHASYITHQKSAQNIIDTLEMFISFK